MTQVSDNNGVNGSLTVCSHAAYLPETGGENSFVSAAEKTVNAVVDDKEERIGDGRHLLLVVLHIVVLDPLEKGFHTRLTEELDERLVLWQTLVRTEKKLSAFLLVAFRDQFLGLVEALVHESALAGVEARYRMAQRRMA